jgi:hypothetical protein
MGPGQTIRLEVVPGPLPTKYEKDQRRSPNELLRGRCLEPTPEKFARIEPGGEVESAACDSCNERYFEPTKPTSPQGEKD